MSYDLAIIGAGIVGSSLAANLAPHLRLALIDRDIRGLPGSTGHAPGFVGQLNTLAPLTELARRTVKAYRAVPGGFNDVGGLEIAREAEHIANLEERAALAAQRGLPAKIISGEEAAALAPAIVPASGVGSAAAALHFPDDGTANARHLAHAAQDAAAAAGADLVDYTDVAEFAFEEKEGLWVLKTTKGEIAAKRLAICPGIWSYPLLPFLPAAVSVSHPYAYGAPRPARAPSPFVRWPADHVYARDHGNRDGLGSYAHTPVEAIIEDTAVSEWLEELDGVLDAGLELLPAETRERFMIEPLEAEEEAHAGREGGAFAFNGAFTVTPDGMPLVGPLKAKKGRGLYCAVGVWVTHAAGCAALLADQIRQDRGDDVTVSSVDAGLRVALDPHRFDGQPAADVHKAALASYNDIYNKDKDDK